MPSPVHARQNQSSNKTVLPSKLPVNVAKQLQHCLQPAQIEKGFTWILNNANEENDLLTLTEVFLEHYEKEVLKRNNNILGDHLPVFRSALVAVFIIKLPRYRMNMADMAYNYVFMDTWLKKKLLAEIKGVTMRDVELGIYLSEAKPREFLSDKLKKLVPITFLNKIFGTNASL